MLYRLTPARQILQLYTQIVCYRKCKTPGSRCPRTLNLIIKMAGYTFNSHIVITFFFPSLKAMFNNASRLVSYIRCPQLVTLKQGNCLEECKMLNAARELSDIRLRF